MNGRDARRLSGDVRTPGSASRANARRNGSDAFRLSKNGSAASSVSGSWSIARPSASSLGGERAGEDGGSS